MIKINDTANLMHIAIVNPGKKKPGRIAGV